MDPNDTITEASNASIDLDAARAAVANTKAALQQQELEILAEELRRAEEANEVLVRECRAAQDVFDGLDKKVEAQTHVYYQARTRKAGAPMATQVYRGNGMPRYATHAEKEEWRAGLVVHLTEEENANAAAAAALAELSRLQGERRMATTKLQDLSWKEHDARVLADGLRKRLEKMKPRGVAAGPWVPPNPPDSQIMLLTNDHSVRSDPATSQYVDTSGIPHFK
ncbi:MAG: hypothetical protein WCE63_23300 [Acidobacteriaceae bacterium]